MREQPTVDLLGSPYLSETIELPDDEEGRVVATLVSRSAGPSSRGAVLHVHGFCDYFFHTETADFWVERGYDFYAVDLRKFGRSLLPHQTPNYTTDLGHYFPELDEALRRIRIRDGHQQVLVSGHSTGGMVAALWLASRRHKIQGLVLNSPWLDMQGSALLRTAGTKLVDRVGFRRPRLEIKRDVSGIYGRSIHKDFEGEWDFNLAWKPLESWPVYAGWFRAIRRGHAALHRDLHLDVPILVLTSSASTSPKAWQASVTSTDIVLDVDQMARWAPRLGEHLTLVRIPGAMHDVTLSAEPVRKRVYDELGRWLAAYVEGS